MVPRGVDETVVGVTGVADCSFRQKPPFFIIVICPKFDVMTVLQLDDNYTSQETRYLLGSAFLRRTNNYQKFKAKR